MTDLSRTTLYTCYTLIDITRTGVTRHEGKERNQQRNYESLLQTISLRAQPVYLEEPGLLPGADLSQYKFGSDYTGNHNVWRFVFGVEHRDIFALVDDPVGLLMEDVNHTPILSLLDETVVLRTPIFSTQTDSKNTYFTIE